MSLPRLSLPILNHQILQLVQIQAFPFPAVPTLSVAPELFLFLLTSLNPATNIINPSTPKITARVTIAPMTPATAFDTPPPLPLPLPFCELELEFAGPAVLV